MGPGVDPPASESARLLQRGARLLSGETARKGYLSGVDQALISLTNFLTSILLARAVSPTQFGAYGVGFLLLHLGRAVQEGLVVQPMTSLASSLHADERRGYYWGSALLQAALAGAGAVLCGLAGRWLVVLGNDVAGPTLFALWFPVLLAQPQEFIRRVFYTSGQVGRAVGNTVVVSLVRLMTLGWMLALGERSGTVGLYAIGWGGAAGLLLGLVQARGVWLARRGELAAAWRRSWAFGRWVLGGTVANWGAAEVYPILTAGLVSFAAAGAYRALQNVVAPVHALLRAMDTYFTPRLAERRGTAGGAGVAHLLRRMLWVTGLPVAGVLLTAVVFAEPLLRLLYGETYVEYAPGMRLMAGYYALWYAYWPMQSALKALGNPRPIFVGSVLATLSMFTVGVWAILRWQVYGTIAGQGLSAAILVAVLWTAWFRWRRRNPEAGTVRPA